MRKSIGVAICAAILTGPASVHAQQANCTPPVQGEKEFLGPILANVLLPALATVAGKGLDYLTRMYLRLGSVAGCRMAWISLAPRLLQHVLTEANR